MVANDITTQLILQLSFSTVAGEISLDDMANWITDFRVQCGGAPLRFNVMNGSAAKLVDSHATARRWHTNYMQHQKLSHLSEFGQVGRLKTPTGTQTDRIASGNSSLDRRTTLPPVCDERAPLALYKLLHRTSASSHSRHPTPSGMSTCRCDLNVCTAPILSVCYEQWHIFLTAAMRCAAPCVLGSLICSPSSHHFAPYRRRRGLDRTT